MKITQEYIESLNPCKDRLDHYLTHYSGWSGSLSDFLGLEHLTHSDKTWVFVRSVSSSAAKSFAVDCAESVLHIFESVFPKDDRPRKAIEAARLSTGSSKELKADTAAQATYAAAYAAAHAARDARAAARDAYAARDNYAADAAYAAADAAHAAAHAADAAYAAARDADAAYAAYDAAYAAYDAADAAARDAYADNRILEEQKQLELMKKYSRAL